MKLFISSLSSKSGDTPFPENGVRVIIQTGQSNADGRAKNSNTTVEERAYTDYAKIWNPLTAQFEQYQYNVNGNGNGSAHPSEHGPDLHHIYNWQTYFPDEDVYIIKHAVGGTAIIEHLTGGSVYEVLHPYVVDGLDALIADGKIPYVYFFFAQGERDATIGTEGTVYYDRYEDLIDLWRTNLGVQNITWVSYEIARDCYPREPIINAEINNIGTAYSMISVIPTIDLPTLDGLHFTTQSLRDATPDVLQWYKDNLTSPVSNPQ